MIFSAVSLMAVFVDQVAQAPIQVQCVQPLASESWTKWLLQFALSFVPVAGGVGIALWSFQKNRTSEQEQWHRNQVAKHNEWLRDQKRADWSELLRRFSSFGVIVPPYTKSVDYSQVAEHLFVAIERAEEAYKNCLFLEDYFAALENRDFISEFLNNAANVAMEILSQRDSIPSSRSDEEKLVIARRQSDLYTNLRVRYVEFIGRVQREARENISSAAVAEVNE